MGVSVRHNSRLAALVALAAAVMTVAWFSRALQTGSLAAWAWCVVAASVAVLQLLVVRDSRAPLMVADEQGVRVRRGETWSGLRWQDIEHVEVRSPASWLRDGQIVVHPRSASAEETLRRETLLEEHPEDAAAPAVTEAYVVPLARTTRVQFDGLTGDLVSDLDALASGRVPVLVLTRLDPDVSEKPEEPPKSDRQERRWGSRLGRGGASEPLDVDDEGPAEDLGDEVPEPTGGHEHEQDDQHDQHEQDEQDEPDFEPVQPVRETRPAARSEVVQDSVRMLPAAPAIPSQRHGSSPGVVARIDEFEATLEAAQPQPAAEALIGPQIAAARSRARLSIDTLSERTRIRPHVLECIEVDDFEPCGGDFYARGHLRTLARIFGLDPQPLLDLYDGHYAQAEIEARQVFEAELATGIGGGVRAAHTGPRWSLLAACVLALVGIWGVARVFNDAPQELVSPAPNVVDSAGLAKADPAQAPKMTLAPLEVTAVGASPQVVIRDRDGRILWADKLAEGQRQQVIGLAPFDVTASNGAAVKVSFLGKPKGTVGDSKDAGSKQFG